jgi:hypothetical protein
MEAAPDDPKKVDLTSRRDADPLLTARDVLTEAARLRPGERISVVDLAPPDGVLRADQWERLFEVGSLRILASRTWDAFPYVSRILVWAEKVGAKDPVDYRKIATQSLPTPSSFSVRVFKRAEGGATEVLATPAEQTELIPYFVADQEMYAILDQEQPRLMSAARKTWSKGAAYWPVPLKVDPGTGKRALRRGLRERFATKVKNVGLGAVYYPAPLEQLAVGRPLLLRLAEAPSGLGGARIFAVRELLTELSQRTSDARLELSLFRLYAHHGGRPAASPKLPLAAVKLPDFKGGALALPRAKVWSERRSWFRAVKPEFWRFERGTFIETGVNDVELSRRNLEYAMPKTYSSDLMTFLPLARNGDEIWIGLQLVHAPAPQLNGQSSAIWTLPTLGLPVGVGDRSDALDYARVWMERKFGLYAYELRPLGAEFLSGGGVTADMIHPYAVAVSDVSPVSELHWFRLSEVQKELESLSDGPLLMSLYRALYSQP